MHPQVFFEPPANFHSKLEVATCYLRFQNKLLFLERAPHKSQGGLWGVPGGKVEKNQGAKSEMIREVFEETTIDLSKTSIHEFGALFIRYPEVDFIYHMFGVRLLDGPSVVLNPEEHVGFAWLSLKQALTLPLVLFEDSCTFTVWNDSFFDGCEKPVLSKKTF